MWKVTCATLWCSDSLENIAQEICGCDKTVAKLRQEKSHLNCEAALSLGSSRGGHCVLHSLRPLRSDGKGLRSTQWDRSDFISAQQQ